MYFSWFMMIWVRCRFCVEVGRLILCLVKFERIVLRIVLIVRV